MTPSARQRRDLSVGRPPSAAGGALPTRPRSASGAGVNGAADRVSTVQLCKSFRGRSRRRCGRMRGPLLGPESSQRYRHVSRHTTQYMRCIQSVDQTSLSIAAGSAETSDSSRIVGSAARLPGLLVSPEGAGSLSRCRDGGAEGGRVSCLAGRAAWEGCRWAETVPQTARRRSRHPIRTTWRPAVGAASAHPARLSAAAAGPSLAVGRRPADQRHVTQRPGLDRNTAAQE